MSLPVTLEKIGADLYFVSRWNQLSEPVQHVTKWKVQGPTFRIPDEAIGQQYTLRHSGGGSIMVASIRGVPFGFIDLWIGSRQQADIVENLPLPQPKVRAGIPVRYHDSGWQKYTKREGWISA